MQHCLERDLDIEKRQNVPRRRGRKRDVKMLQGDFKCLSAFSDGLLVTCLEVLLSQIHNAF